ncbi:hypothetical protein CALVIDRAFT_535679 [Calocera viscosa TUFC12733]|uniref:Uncharacterized protein n=1 Tax=Calocera viscosa (strain TUFC12733) TaxID=1330018 RepID=A0A167NU70_CALVF|nr:hypothetical protein CALVIDRAFT_535679 [Calocera viscosa TUFC12733]
MAMRSGYGYVHLEGEENEHRRAREGKAREQAPSPHRRRSEWEDHTVGGAGQSSLPRLPMPPAELEKDVEKERLAWAERDLPPNMPLPAAAPGLRKRTGSRPASRSASFVEIIEGPGLPVSAYIPLTPTTTHTGSGSPRPAEPRLPHPHPSQSTQQFPPLLSPPMSASSVPAPAPVIRTLSPRSVLSPVPQPPPQLRAYTPLQTIEDVTSPLAGEHAVHLVLRSPASLGREATYALASSAQGSPYPSRPPSALSSVLSPPHSSLSLARSHSWTNVSRGSGVLSEDVLSQSSRDVFGTDDEEEGAASELGSVSDFGSAWDTVSRRSGMSGSEHHVRL